jgi:hypothetical protein
MSHDLQVTPEKVRSRASTIQLHQNHDYADATVRKIADAKKMLAARTALRAQTLQHQLNPMQTEEQLNKMAAVKQAVHTALINQGYTKKDLNGLFGTQYKLNQGIHEINMWDVNGVLLLKFMIHVLGRDNKGNKQTLDDLTKYDYNTHTTGVLNMSQLKEVLARPFIELHTIDSLAHYERDTLFASIRRQKANTKILIDADAKARFIREIATRSSRNELTTTRHFITTEKFQVCDMDPATRDLVTFWANIEYDVFHHPNGLWQVSHYHGSHNVEKHKVMTKANKVILKQMNNPALKA